MNKEPLVFVGTYTDNNPSEGIYVYRFDPATGALRFVRTAPKVDNPSFLAIAPDKKHLYAVNENVEGKLSAFTLDPDSGELRLMNQESTRGKHPCHVIVDPSGKMVVTANYSSGNIAVFPVQGDGSVGPTSDFIQHRGTGPNKERQEGPHAHSVTLDPSGKYAIAADLGADKLFVYRIDAAKGKLTPHTPDSVSIHAGAGPRHFAFHPNGRVAYAIDELDSTITVLSYDKRRGAFSELQTISTLPGEFKGSSTCADIHVHPSGKFVYGSNRGHDSIAMFAVDGRTGKLTSLGQESTRGKTPRNFALTPDGAFLLAANQSTNNIVSFRIDPTRGRLTATGQETAVPAPVCIKFLV